MTKYPNREALRKAHDIYRDAMREFIFQYLEKRVKNENVDDLIMRVLNREQHGTIDIKGISAIFKNRKCWNDFFSHKFGYDQRLGRNGYDIRSVTSLIVMGRNKVSHPGSRDLDLEYTCTHLFLITEVLEEIGKTQAKCEVQDIWDELCSDEPEEHPAKVENVDLKERLAEMADRLAVVETEKAEYKEYHEAELKKSEADKAEYEELLDAMEKENAELKERLSETENPLKVIELESDEHIETLTDKTELEERYEPTSIKVWRRKIWKQLCDYAAQKDTPVRFNKPGSENYLNVSRSLIDLTGFYMKVWLGGGNREITIRLYMPKQNFYIFEKQRKEIEQEFCESLEWEELPQRRDSRISLRKGIIDPTDESDWQNQHEWVISKLEKFHKKFNEVFLPMITMNSPKRLTVVIVRKLILQKFQGHTLVRTAEIITHVEKLHCEGVRKLSENEKMIVSDALASLRKKGLATNSERRGYWSFHDSNPFGTAGE